MSGDIITAIFNDAAGLMVIIGLAAFLIGAGRAVMVMMRRGRGK